MSWLPNDVARCRGVGDDVDGWREGVGNPVDFDAGQR